MTSRELRSAINAWTAQCRAFDYTFPGAGTASPGGASGRQQSPAIACPIGKWSVKTGLSTSHC